MSKSTAFLTFLILLSANSLLFSQADVGVGLSPWDYGPVEKKSIKDNPPDSFVKLLAIEQNQDEKELAKLFNTGFGRNELIKLALISGKSKEKLKDIVALRQKNMRLSSIAGKYNLDYGAILEESEAIRQKIDYELSIDTSSAPPAEVIISTADRPSTIDHRQ
jgi:hypothetical protein